MTAMVVRKGLDGMMRLLEEIIHKAESSFKRPAYKTPEQERIRIAWGKLALDVINIYLAYATDEEFEEIEKRIKRLEAAEKHM